MKRMYRNVVRDLLASEILGHKDLAPDFFRAPAARQKQIESEIEAKSAEIADDVVAELKKRGYIDKEPDRNELTAVFRDVMKRHGVSR